MCASSLLARRWCICDNFSSESSFEQPAQVPLAIAPTTMSDHAATSAVERQVLVQQLLEIEVSAMVQHLPAASSGQA